MHGSRRYKPRLSVILSCKSFHAPRVALRCGEGHCSRRRCEARGPPLAFSSEGFPHTDRIDLTGSSRMNIVRGLQLHAIFRRSYLTRGLVLAILGFSLAACGGSDDGGSTPNPPAPPPPPPPPAQLPP